MIAFNKILMIIFSFSIPLLLGLLNALNSKAKKNIIKQFTHKLCNLADVTLSDENNNIHVKIVVGSDEILILHIDKIDLDNYTLERKVK